MDIKLDLKMKKFSITCAEIRGEIVVDIIGGGFTETLIKSIIENKIKEALIKNNINGQIILNNKEIII